MTCKLWEHMQWHLIDLETLQWVSFMHTSLGVLCFISSDENNHQTLKIIPDGLQLLCEVLLTENSPSVLGASSATKSDRGKDFQVCCDVCAEMSKHSSRKDERQSEIPNIIPY